MKMGSNQRGRKCLENKVSEGKSGNTLSYIASNSVLIIVSQPVVFPGGTSGNKPACQCRRHKNVGLIPGSGRSPGEGHGSPVQYSCLENPMDRGAWQATVKTVAGLDTTEVI